MILIYHLLMLIILNGKGFKFLKLSIKCNNRILCKNKTEIIGKGIRHESEFVFDDLEYL